MAKKDEAASLPPDGPAVRNSVLAIVAEMATTGIGKDRKNEQQGFRFRGIDDILNALSSLYVKHRVLVLPAYSDRVQYEYTTQKGARLVNVTLAASYRITSLIDGSELISGPFYGEGMDSGDKATNKAMSIAYKYFAIQTFAIPIVGSDDPDFETHEPAAKAARPVAEKQQPVAAARQEKAKPAAAPADGDETVAAAIKRLSTTKDGHKKLTALICAAYGVVVVDQLPEDKREEAIARLEAYVATAAQKKAA